MTVQGIQTGEKRLSSPLFPTGLHNFIFLSSLSGWYWEALNLRPLSPVRSDLHTAFLLVHEGYLPWASWSLSFGPFTFSSQGSVLSPPRMRREGAAHPSMELGCTVPTRRYTACPNGGLNVLLRSHPDNLHWQSALGCTHQANWSHIWPQGVISIRC